MESNRIPEKTKRRKLRSEEKQVNQSKGVDEDTIGEGVRRIYLRQAGNLKREGSLGSEHTCPLSVRWEM